MGEWGKLHFLRITDQNGLNEDKGILDKWNMHVCKFEVTKSSILKSKAEFVTLHKLYLNIPESEKKKINLSKRIMEFIQIIKGKIRDS